MHHVARFERNAGAAQRDRDGGAIDCRGQRVVGDGIVIERGLCTARELRRADSDQLFVVAVRQQCHRRRIRCDHPLSITQKLRIGAVIKQAAESLFTHAHPLRHRLSRLCARYQLQIASTHRRRDDDAERDGREADQRRCQPALPVRRHSADLRRELVTA